ncbi:porin [Rhodoblastus sp.]|uniref:porin n=1 Tax=Rhodoblastus sp. TaxID=1962975 RepID=UPI003F9D385F
MKKQLMATAAALAILTATAARADEISDLKAQSAALKKQNQALEQRLNKLEKQEAAQQQTQQKQAAQLAAAPAPTSFMAADLSSLKGAVPSCALPSLDGPLTFCGITLYGTVDAGLGWVSHGLPENGYNYEGESLVNRNGNHAQWGVAQNNLSQTGLGIKGTEELLPGWSGVFNASTGINPQSGQLANMAGTMTSNNGLPRNAYSFNGDGARAGQAFNDQLYVGISNITFGTLTFGRQRSLGTDTMLAYDPAGGAYSFSYIGYNGTMAGGGDTQDTRWDDALKYRVEYGPVHFAAMYKFADGSGGCYSAAAAAGNAWTSANCTPEAAHNDAYGFNLGGTYNNFSADVVVQHVNQAISVVNPLLGPTTLAKGGASTQNTLNSIDTTAISGANLISPTNTEYGIVTDNTAVMGAVKYVWNEFKFFGGYEYILQHNPANPLGVGATAQGGYLLSGVEDNNLDSPKVVQIFWTGVKYAYDAKTDITLSYYHQLQNTFFQATSFGGGCPVTNYRSSCSGTLDEVSLYADYHFTKRFDVYAGLAYSQVANGLSVAIPHNGAGGVGVPYFYNNNWAPTVGARYTF